MPDQFYTDERGDSRKGDVAHTEVTVGVASTQIVAANPNRRYLLIQHVGTNPVFLRFDETAAVLNEGFRLTAGEIFEWPGPNNALYREAVNGIVLAGTEDLLVAEA